MIYRKLDPEKLKEIYYRLEANFLALKKLGIKKDRAEKAINQTVSQLSLSNEEASEYFVRIHFLMNLIEKQSERLNSLELVKNGKSGKIISNKFFQMISEFTFNEAHLH